jgi:phage terminase large subunit-like protein
MAERIGSQTPSQAVLIPFRQSKGEEAVALYEESGRHAQDWQKLLITNIMGQNDDGLWTHTKFGYEVPRQNGKGEVLTMREFWGLKNGENVMHTAHKTSTSHSAFMRLVKILTDAGYVELGRKKKGEKTPEKSFKSTKQYGLEQIFMTGGGSIVFRTRTETGGLGEGFDLLVIDEAQEYTGSQQTALIYTIAASRNPQTIFCGTPPTLVSKGEVFPKLRRDVLAGKGEDSGWCEWSVYEKPKDLMDPEAWYATNPSLGTILKERTIRAEFVGDSLDFIIQRLGYWHTYELKSEISEADWMALKVPAVPELSGPLYVGVRFGSNNENTSMSIAVRTKDGRIFLETIGCESQTIGFGWIVRFLQSARVGAVAVDGKGKTELLEEVLKQNGVRVKYVAMETSQVITACSGFRQSIDDLSICHMGQPSVTQSIANCEKRMIGTNGAFGFRSLKPEVDVTIVESLALARWICSVSRERRKQRIGY